MQKILLFIKNLFFPIKCISCNKDGVYICERCLQKIEKADFIKEDWIISVWSYKNKYIKKLLWLLKFKGQFSSIKELVPTLYDYLHDELIESKIFEALDSPILVPIPISKKRMRYRGYNQSLIIGKFLIKESDNKFTLDKNILEKVFDRAPQNTIKNKRQRFENIKNTFKIKNGADVTNKFIILIDDITTTHATLIEAKKVLDKAGAKKVLAITIAH